MTNLYEKHKNRFDELSKNGYSAIAEMAKRFTDHNDMAIELGYSNGTVRHWIDGSNGISAKSHRLVKDWLKRPDAIAAGLRPETGTSDATNGDGLYLVTCPAGTQEKARKLLTFIGCEMIEV